MKNLKLISTFLTLFVVLFIIVFYSCNKKDNSTTTNKTTGHLNILGILPATIQEFGCCSDPAIPITNIHVNLEMDISGWTPLKTVNGSNNSTFDCGELDPGNYRAYIAGTYTMKEDHSGAAPCGNCYGGTSGHSTSYLTFQIIANQDKTVTCQ